MLSLLALLKLAIFILKVTFLIAVGGEDLGATVRLMLKKIGTNKLWSNYSFKGKKKKQSFQNLAVCGAIVSKCHHCFLNYVLKFN